MCRRQAGWLAGAPPDAPMSVKRRSAFQVMPVLLGKLPIVIDAAYRPRSGSSQNYEAQNEACGAGSVDWLVVKKLAEHAAAHRFNRALGLWRRPRHGGIPAAWRSPRAR